MHSIKVNIVILNWNGWKDTISCINSLQNTEARKLANIIVIDNGSSDDSIYRIKKSYPDIELIENGSNLGFGGGCNVGLLKSINDEVDFVWLLNNDTKAKPGSLEALLNIARSDIRTGVIGSIIYSMDEPDRIKTWGGGSFNFWSGGSKYIHRQKDTPKLKYITGASMLIRIQALREVGLFDESSYFMYWEDADLCRRFSSHAWRLAVAEDSAILHKESASFSENHHLLVRYFNQSAVAFFCKFYRFCIIPVFIGLSRRLIMRIIYMDLKGFREIVMILRHQFSKPLLRLFR